MEKGTRALLLIFAVATLLVAIVLIYQRWKEQQDDSGTGTGTDDGDPIIEPSPEPSPDPSPSPGPTEYFELTGSVWNKITNIPIQGAILYVDGVQKATTTSNGTFLVKLPAGGHGIQMSKLGYQSIGAGIMLDADKHWAVPMVQV